MAARLKRNKDEVTHEMLVNHLVDEEGVDGVVALLVKVSQKRAAKTSLVNRKELWNVIASLLYDTWKDLQAL